MSAFSKSASQAIGNLQSQYIAGEKSQIAVTEESQKLAQLATKLEWAKMVEQMSDSSKVLILKEPKQLRPFENSSPKLLTNIMFGIIFGWFASLIALIFVEIKDKKLTYSALSNNIIFDGLNNVDTIGINLLSYKPKKILLIALTQLPQDFVNKIQKIPNAEITYADITPEFVDKIANSDKIIIVSKIQVTNKDSYKKIHNIINKQNKTIEYDILV